MSFLEKNKITSAEIYYFCEFDFAFFVFLDKDEEISGYKQLSSKLPYLGIYFNFCFMKLNDFSLVSGF